MVQPLPLSTPDASPPVVDAPALRLVVDVGVEPGPMTETEEAELVARALAGEGRAFGALVEPHLDVLYRLAHRACGDADLAEDAVQETLALAHRRLGRYRPGTSLRAWLAAIAVRRAHTLLRSERRRAARRERGSRPGAPARPDEAYDAAEAAARLRAALATLPRKRREAVLLRLDAGLAHREIAAAIGSSEASVRVLVHLAMQQLRDALSLGDAP